MKIEIYSKSDCPYCHLAKSHLTQHGITYLEQVYDDYEQRQSMYNSLGLQGHQRTVPQVFLIESNGHRERIGGYSELIQSDLIARHHAGEFDAEF
jgi:glutaredoxin